MPVEANVAVVRAWIEAYNDRDAEKEAASRALGFVAHISGMPAPLDGVGWTQFITSFATSFPDLRLFIEDIVADEETVAARVSFHGTHLGEFQGVPPTGRGVTFTSMEFNRIAGGRVAEHWVELDLTGLMRQIEAIPTPEPATI